MLPFVRRATLATLLAVPGCGYFGFELLELPAADGGVRDAQIDDAGRESGPPLDAAADGSHAMLDATLVGRDGATNDAQSSDGSAISIGDGSTRADAAASCATGFADCDGTPSTCETQLGTTSHCTSCTDVCAANGGIAACGAGGCETQCIGTSTLAVKIVVNLSWPAGLTAAGSGSSTIWARWIATASGNSMTGPLEPCGFTLPDFSLNPAVANETYSLSFPDTLFDHAPAYIPAATLTGNSASGFVLGQPFTIATSAIQVGAALTNPATDAWPAALSLSSPDSDADGKPGVTGAYSNASGYLFPRVDATGIPRADLAYAAARFVFSGGGTLSSCTDTMAQLTFSHFDTHVVGCHVSGGADCSSTQRDTVDTGRPIFAPTSATMHVLNIASGASCAAVRAAVP